MKDLNQFNDDLFFDLLDGKLSREESARMIARIESSPVLKTRYEEARAIHQLLKSSSWADPSMNFTRSVMSKLNDAPAPVVPSYWKGLLLLIGMMLTIGITMILVSQGVFDASTTVDLNNINLPKGIPDQSIPTFDLSGKTIVNIIMVMNIVVGFVLLDRAVLKPIFRKRMIA